MSREKIINDYFEWLSNKVCDSRCRRVGYRKILVLLHNIPFRYSIEKDSNRAADGIDLRLRFANDEGYRDVSEYLETNCSVLEMLVALSLRCESEGDIGSDVGDIPTYWFWVMMRNLGLDCMTDEKFNRENATQRIRGFVDRRYGRNGEGNIFTFRNSVRDLRSVEIWYQMCWYLNEHQCV